MGLLTDARAGQGRLSRLLVKNYWKLCVIFYICGVGYFCLLAHPSMSQATYFSENALLPGLVKSEFRDDGSASAFHNELLHEMDKHSQSIPYAWLLAKFKQIGLDTYTHNFSVVQPLGKGYHYTGKNVYGILRAVRAASTEALVLSTPFRSKSSVHPTTAPSIALMLAFAKFAIKEKYWAKDIIFLVTDHEQLGIQAWLEAYHGISFGIIRHGLLNGRAGAIQAAINLELHNPIINQLDIKIEGLNGQLPNLDLVNLAAKLASKEDIFHSIKMRPARTFRNDYSDWRYAFGTLMSMVATQATGIPNGNHGLFHRFGIESLTIEGISKPNSRLAGRNVRFVIMGRLIESIFRSLNNLLERLHQSYFFYLLPATDRFVSIGVYMPVVCMIAGTLLIKACAKWYEIQLEYCDDDERDDRGDSSGMHTDETKEIVKTVKLVQTPPFTDTNFWQTIRNYFMEERLRAFCDMISPQSKSAKNPLEKTDPIGIVITLVLLHGFGVLLMNSTAWLSRLGGKLAPYYYHQVTSEMSLVASLVLISVFMTLLVPWLCLRTWGMRSVVVLHICALLELGTALICVAMNNFSLAIFLCVFVVPFALAIEPNHKCIWAHYVQQFAWGLCHPLAVLTVTVIVYTFCMFGAEQSFLENVMTAVTKAAPQALVFGVVDAEIYGNWMFSVVTSVFLPNWLCFWTVARCRNLACNKASTDGFVSTPASAPTPHQLASSTVPADANSKKTN